MAIDLVQLSDEQVEVLLAASEGHFLDFKAVDVAPSKLSKSLAAFANADGGELFVGLAENKEAGSVIWAGFPNQEAANGHLQALESVFPLGTDFLYEFLHEPNRSGLVLHITIIEDARN